MIKRRTREENCIKQHVKAVDKQPNHKYAVGQSPPLSVKHYNSPRSARARALLACRWEGELKCFYGSFMRAPVLFMKLFVGPISGMPGRHLDP